MAPSAHSATVTGVAFAIDGHRFGSVSKDMTFRQWNMPLR
jgi:hypothetical protein